MPKPGTYLTDAFIDYAQENKTSLARAAKLLVEFAKQRTPEKALADQATDARRSLRDRVDASPREYFVARILVRRRVRYIRWPYYPQFHLAGPPRPYWWCTINYRRLWRTRRPAGHFYLDDLFHDAGQERFWMPEPYLEGLPESHALYTLLSQKTDEVVEDTGLRKIDPEVVAAFKRVRKRAPEFRRKDCDKDEIWDRRPYGSRGWKKRVALIPVGYRRIRLA